MLMGLTVQEKAPSSDRADIAWIADNAALNPGLNDRLAPEIPQALSQRANSSMRRPAGSQLV